MGGRILDEIQACLTARQIKVEYNMSERIRFEEHDGKKILYCDFSTLMTDKFNNLLKESFGVIKEHTDLLLLFDVNKATVFGDSLKQAKDFARKIQPYRKKSALIGIAGPKKVLLESILLFSGSAKFVKAFSDKETAFDWLIR